MGCRFDGAALKPAQFRPESVTWLEGLLEDSVSPRLLTPQGPVSSLPHVVFSGNQGQGTQFTLFLYRGGSGMPGSSDVENNMPIYKWVLKIMGEPI